MALFGRPKVHELTAKRDVRGLIKALRHSDSTVRLGAADALGRLGGADAVEPLCVSLSDPEWTVRHSAAKALGELGDARAVPALARALEDPMGSVAQAAGFALAATRDPRAVEPLMAQPFTFNSAVRLLLHLGDARGVDMLLTARGISWMHPDDAADAFLRLEDPRIVPWLIGVLSDEDIDVRKSAADVLGRLGDSTAVEPLSAALADLSRRSHPSPREAVMARVNFVRALRAILADLEARADVPAAFELLGAADSWIREYAAVVLERVGQGNVLERVAEELGQQVAEVRTRAESVARDLERLSRPIASQASLEDQDRRDREIAWKSLARSGVGTPPE